MKRDIIVAKLIQEGFSEKTLVKFTDKQLTELSERILGEENIMISTKDPQYQQKVAAAKKSNKTIETYEEKSEEMCESCHKSKKDCNCKKKEMKEEKPSEGLSKEKKSEVVKKAKKGEDIGKKGKGFEKLADKAAKEYGSKEKGEKVAAAAMWKNIKKESIETKKWVNKLAEEKFHSFTSKNEIMELIQTKLTESEVMEPQHGSKVKKGHNGVPEFMSYDVITNDGDTKTAPAKPTTKPGTKPGTTPSKPKTPYQPGPGPKHKPKALAEEKK